MGGKGTFNKDFDPVCGDLAKAGRFFVPQVRVDRDLGSRDRSMVETDQVKNGQSAAFLDVLQGPRIISPVLTGPHRPARHAGAGGH